MGVFQGFDEVKKICAELEKIRINAQAGEIVYRQKGEYLTADRFLKLENQITKAIGALREVE